ncbi:MAG: hypothetical protein IAF58_00210, partial [Leptolyngbya sp.]|nr:hypothetical protein [Candidatus Melainabacteria bacterium]
MKHHQLQYANQKEDIMSDNNNPLGGRGKAEEERWAREQDRQAIEKMK